MKPSYPLWVHWMGYDRDGFPTRRSIFWRKRFSFTEVPGVNTTGCVVTNEVEEK